MPQLLLYASEGKKYTPVSTRVRFQAGAGILFSNTCRQSLWPTKYPIQWVLATLSPEVKRPERESEHSPPSNNVNNECSFSFMCPPHFGGVALRQGATSVLGLTTEYWLHAE